MAITCRTHGSDHYRFESGNDYGDLIRELVRIAQ
jgi:hypothetical protein